MWWLSTILIVVPETIILWLGIRTWRREHSS